MSACTVVYVWPCDLALDVERGLLYYTDSVLHVIAEISTNGSNRREIFRVSPEAVAIVVDSTSRLTKL